MITSYTDKESVYLANFWFQNVRFLLSYQDYWIVTNNESINISEDWITAFFFFFFYCCPPTFLSWQANKLIKNTKIENWSDHHHHHTLIKKAFNLQTFGFKTMRVSKCQNSPWLPRKLNFNKQWECFNISKHWITTFFSLLLSSYIFFLGNQTSK